MPPKKSPKKPEESTESETEKSSSEESAQPEKKEEWVTMPTAGGGNCAFHAIFGEWDGERFFCKEHLARRTALATAIQNCAPDNQPLYKAIIAAIQDRIIHGDNISGDQLKKEKASYTKDKNNYSWDSLKNSLIFKEYAIHLKTKETYLSEFDCKIIALATPIRIHFLLHDINHKEIQHETYNPNQTSNASISYDGVNHFERLSKKDDAASYKKITHQNKPLSSANHTLPNANNERLIFGDDSSDEESTSRVQKYNLQKKFQAYNKTHPLDSKKTKLSFLAHALGVQLLYSEKINYLYYSNKEALLGSSKLRTKQPLPEILERVIKKSLREAFMLFASEINWEDFEKNNSQEILDLTSIIITHGRSLAKDYSDEKLFREHISIIIEQSLVRIRDCLYLYFEKGLPFLKKDTPIKIISPTHLASSNPLSAKKLFPGLVNNLETDFKQSKLLNAAGKIPNSDTKEKTLTLVRPTLTTLTPVKQKAIKDIEAARGGTLFSTIAKRSQTDFLTAHLAGKLATEASSPNSPLKAVTQSQDPDEAKNTEKEYFLETNKETTIIDKELRTIIQTAKGIPERTKKQSFDRKKFTDHLYTQLFKSIKKEIIWDRSTLPSQYTLAIRNSDDAIAGIRLFNRSQTRLLRQRKQDDIGDAAESVSRSWHFEQSHTTTVEKQQVTTSEGRNDLVFDLENYPAIAKKIKNILIKVNFYLNNAKQKPISDAEIAQALRNILNSDPMPLSYVEKKQEKEILLPDEIKKPLFRFLSNLAYLLFSTEVARNPASLIIHQMMLDLIIAGKRSFEYFFEETHMPMSTELATHYSHALHKKLKPYLPYPYTYVAAGSKTEATLSDKEGELIASWLSVFKESIFHQYSHDNSLKPETVDIITKTIEKTMANWYKGNNPNQAQSSEQANSNQYFGRFFTPSPTPPALTKAAVVSSSSHHSIDDSSSEDNSDQPQTSANKSPRK